MIEILNKYTCYNENMLFDEKNMFFLFIPIGIHVFWYFIFRKNTDTTINFSNLSLLSSKKSWKEKLISLPYILDILSISLIILSLSQPYINEKIPLEEKEELSEERNDEQDTINVIDIVIAMDVSGSMLAKDLKPDRLNASKGIAIDFIRKRKNDRIGLVIFAGESFTQCPVTTNHESLINLFNQIEFGMINDGTAIGDAIGTAINRLKDTVIKNRIIILITDGENTSGNISPSFAADIAKNNSIKIYTIGVGTKGMAKSPVAIDFNGDFVYEYKEVKIDEATLTDIARKTGGEYYRATDNNSLESIYQKINTLETTKIIEEEEKKEEEEEEEEEEKKIWQFYKCSRIALILLIFSFLLKISYFRKIN